MVCQVQGLKLTAGVGFRMQSLGFGFRGYPALIWALRPFFGGFYDLHLLLQSTTTSITSKNYDEEDSSRDSCIQSEPLAAVACPSPS